MLSSDEAIDTAAALMAGFAERTGITSDPDGWRYLWTDAFAVCNFLGLARATGDTQFIDLALQLVERVHQVLGRHRADDPRSGWLSGLAEQEGRAHPTRGGLRIGKPLPERGPAEAFNERLEWDRDGQYFHYLTKWMHALDQVSRSTGEPRFNRWARELAEVAHASFVVRSAAGARRMVWKMSCDLSRPLVTSMGQHDPLDGFITCVQLAATASQLPGSASEPTLGDAAADFAGMLELIGLRTEDPLGLGGLLIDGSRVAQLLPQAALEDRHLLEALLVAAHEGLSRLSHPGAWREPASRRLAFRELGLAIGISAIELIQSATHARLAPLEAHRPLGSDIRAFWLDPDHRATRIWWEHREINDVMLATSLIPEGFLDLAPQPSLGFSLNPR